MKTPYEVEQELARLERLVPHIISDQGDRAEEILGFHVASLMQSSAPTEQALVRERAAAMIRRCRTVQPTESWGAMLLQPQLA